MEFTEKETALISQIKTDAETLIAEKTSGLITDTKFTEKMNELKTSNDNVSKELQTKVDELTNIAKEQGLKMQSFAGQDNSNQTVKAQLDSQIDSIKEAIKAGGSKEVVIKATYTRASNTNSTQAYRDDRIAQIGTRRLVAYDLFPKFPLGSESNGVLRYTDWDEATTVSAAATVAEGGTFPESTAKFVELSLPAQKIGDTVPITEEAVQDTARLAREVEMFLQRNVAVVEDTQLLTGAGTGSNLTGVYTAAPTFTAVNSGITDASIYDLIVKVSEHITVSKGSKYMPDFAFMNIADINKMRLKKDANNNYIMPPFTLNNGEVVAGIQIIEANGITANTMVLGDSRYAEIWEAEGYNVSFGYQGTQFGSDIMTMKARKRMLLLIKNADKSGFRKVTSISGALTTLALP